MDSGKKSNVALLILGRDVYVLKRDATQLRSHVVIKAPCSVITASLCTHITSDARQIFSVITTQDNQIWQVPVPQLIQDDIPRETDEKVEGQTEEMMDSEDIFGELLRESQNYENCHDGHPDCCSFKSQDTHNISVKLEHLLHSVDGTVIDMETSDGLMALLVDKLGKAEVHIFKQCPEQCSDVKGKVHGVKLLESFTTGLRSSCFSNYSAQKTKCLFFIKSKRKGSVDNPCASSVSESLGLSSASICMPVKLFTRVFGKEAACLNSSVLIVCTDDGCVYSYEVKSAKSVLQRSLTLVCQLDSSIVGISPIYIPPFSVSGESKIQDIVSALASSVRDDLDSLSTSQGSRICLIIFSSTGRGCIFLPPTQENDCPPVLMFSLPHPIKSFVIHGKSVIFSTGRSVESCEFKISQNLERDHFCLVPETQTLLRKARIAKFLHFASDDGTTDNIITGITDSLDLVPICTHRKETRPDSKAEASHSLTDMLHSIEQSSSTFKSIKKDSEHIDSFLLQMNIFASLIQQAKAQQMSSSTKVCSQTTTDLMPPVIRCVCSVISVENVYRRNWNLKVILRNTSTVSLSRDWIVVVSFCDAKEDLCYPRDESYRQNYSVPLSSGLKFKSSIDICIPLDGLVAVHKVPHVDIKVSLVLNFIDTGPGMANTPQYLHQKSLKIGIHKQKFDILHFLHRTNECSENRDLGSENFLSRGERKISKHWFSSELAKMADVRVAEKVKGNPKRDRSNILNLKVAVSRLQCQEHKLGSPSELLLFLLKDSSIHGDKTLGPHVQCEDPHGQHITIICSSAANSEGSHYSFTEDIPFFVTLKGEDVDALLQTRAAVKSRLKVHNQESSRLQPKTSTELRRQLLLFEEVQKELQHIRSRLASHREDRDESAKLICEMLDKSELLTEYKCDDVMEMCTITTPN